MNNFMLDLETLDTRVTASILSIGVVAFDINAKETGNSFYQTVNLDSCIEHGLTISASTFYWWLAQSDEARARLSRDTTHLDGALLSLTHWMTLERKEHDAYVWGNGAAFDNAILQNAYAACGMPLPWKFYNDRCYRTMKSFAPDVKLDRIGIHHDPRDDAESQARHLIKILNP